MTDLRAIFETADAAEWALMRLRERGLHPDRYSVRAVERGQPEEPRGFLSNTAAALFGIGYGRQADAYPAGSTAYAPFGGLLGDDARLGHDVISSEAELRLTVPDRDAKTVKGILISNRGRVAG
ncbi:MAG: hypothetical protein FWG93_05375 [Oscillospiraceae bacterium]|nr:hypothetical protein [Oscillospiraceae bacterium]